MKKLYENIEDIHIKGGVDQLTEIVTAMDISLQNIAADTEQLTELLMKYSVSNKGTQYEKVLNTAMELRDVLFTASMALNEMQNQIVVYQNKIFRYEDMAESASKPNPYLVTRKQLNADTSIVQFNRNDMLCVAASLKNYGERVIHHIRTINEKKNQIANVWCDTQYLDFSEFVDDVTRTIIDALKTFDEYVTYLGEKIRELN